MKKKKPIILSEIKPEEKKKYEIPSSEQLELVMLTEAFLRTNDDFEISNSLIKDYDINTYGNKFNVAAEYYYYLNHDKLTEEVLVNYDAIMELAKKIYDTNVRSKAVLTPIGYKELFEYFDNKITKEEAIELIKQRSRKYAKRQYTWNNHQFNVNWFNVDFNNFENTVNNVLNFINK